MPQIKVYLNPWAGIKIGEKTFRDLDFRLRNAVKTAFKDVNSDDIAFDIFDVRYTTNEQPVQIEVHYTAGSDEYGTGKIFDPSDEEKQKAVSNILGSFAVFLQINKITRITPSVWIRPQYKSVFKPGDTIWTSFEEV